ncbi:MAG: 2-C-methyl-D-erythritol 4-phosphate cytidylyltransferase [Geodermatophilaceae bacterium]
MNSACWGVVVAAGRGERLGGDRAKALFELGGTALVMHAVRALRDGGCAGIVVAAPAALIPAVAGLFGESCGTEATLAPGPVVVVAGGSSRQESVAAALEAVPDNVRWVLVHDAARPLVPVHVVTAVRIRLAAGAPAVVPVLPVVDTIKCVDPAGLIIATVDRSRMRFAQTPQGFERDLLVRALDESARRGDEVTDDAAAVAALGVAVQTVPGDERGLKITTPADLILAEALLAAQSDR